MDDNFDWGAEPTKEELAQLLEFLKEKGVALPFEEGSVLGAYKAALKRLEAKGLLWDYLF